ncbi:hypothetical protein Sjap_004245 [Stephania japonica]|uniref:Uncharacterized protein n=1 Tax=Stephania japonica TaxID=461633 RepID=A0AAP0K1Y0_9MAGN
MVESVLSKTKFPLSSIAAEAALVPSSGSAFQTSAPVPLNSKIDPLLVNSTLDPLYTGPSPFAVQAMVLMGILANHRANKK